MRRARKSYQEVLGVAPDASPSEVKRAYRALAKRLHPDRLHNPEAARAAEERLKEINAAWNDYLASLKRGGDGRRAKRGASPAKPPSAPDEGDADERAPGAAYQTPRWRERRVGRETRDRYRAERVRATRGHEERERRSREAAEQVRRERDAEIRERVERDHVRAAGIVWIVVLAVGGFVALILALVALSALAR